MTNFSRGDKVSWQSQYGRIHGKIVRKIERDTKIDHHTIHASKDDPQYMVKSDKTGSRAVHKPDALNKE